MEIIIHDPNPESPPKRTFSRQELYRYGLLMALAEEQSEAINKLLNRDLGWWGRTRIHSRVTKMLSLLDDLVRDKPQRLRSLAIEEIRADLISIDHHGLVGEFYSDGARSAVESVLDQL
jgi:hypothetical protein